MFGPLPRDVIKRIISEDAEIRSDRMGWEAEARGRGCKQIKINPCSCRGVWIPLSLPM